MYGTKRYKYRDNNVLLTISIFVHGLYTRLLVVLAVETLYITTSRTQPKHGTSSPDSYFYVLRKIDRSINKFVKQ